MGQVMIAKCAEAQALRRGWPDVLSGLVAKRNCTRSNRERKRPVNAWQAKQKEADKLRVAASNALWLIFDPNAGLESVAREEVASRIRAYYHAATSAAGLEAFQERNRESLKISWDWAPGEALELKMLADAIGAERAQATPAQTTNVRKSAASGENVAQQKREGMNTPVRPPPHRYRRQRPRAD
jgi:hypothetical protein